MIKHILYHENNRKEPYKPQEDAYDNTDYTYVVADLPIPPTTAGFNSPAGVA